MGWCLGPAPPGLSGTVTRPVACAGQTLGPSPASPPGSPFLPPFLRAAPSPSPEALPGSAAASPVSTTLPLTQAPFLPEASLSSGSPALHLSGTQPQPLLGLPQVTVLEGRHCSGLCSGPSLSQVLLCLPERSLLLLSFAKHWTSMHRSPSPSSVSPSPRWELPSHRGQPK